MNRSRYMLIVSKTDALAPHHTEGFDRQLDCLIRAQGLAAKYKNDRLSMIRQGKCKEGAVIRWSYDRISSSFLPAQRKDVHPRLF